MDVHHVVEATGIVVIGLVAYSYGSRWFQPVGRLDRRWRPIFNGVVFGLLSVALMMARIQVGEGRYLDARAVPIALIGLFEGGPAVTVAAAVATAYRLSRGGGGAIAGVVGIAGTALAAWLVHRWARGRVTAKHALILTLIVYAVNFGSFMMCSWYGS